jgi:hypothetical protein
MISHPIPGILFVLLWTCASASDAVASVLVSGDLADMLVRKDGSRVAVATGRVGAATSTFPTLQGRRSAVYVFRLPSPGPGDVPLAQSANFQFTIVADLPDGNYDIDLYGLPARAAPTVLSGDNFVPGAPSSATLIQAAIVGRAHADTGVETVTTSLSGGAALVDYLNVQYGAGGSGVGQYVFLRLNPTTDPPNQDTGVDVAFAESTGQAPLLTITFVPEPTCLLLLLPLGQRFFRRRQGRRSSRS